MDDVSTFQLPVLCHEGDTILQDEVMCVCRFVGLDAAIPNDLVEALHRQIEDKTFISVDLPLLIIRKGTQHEDVAPVCILKDLGIDYIGQCNFFVTFIQRKDDGWLQRGGVMVLTLKYTCLWKLASWRRGIALPRRRMTCLDLAMFLGLCECAIHTQVLNHRYDTLFYYSLLFHPQSFCLPPCMLWYVPYLLPTLAFVAPS